MADSITASGTTRAAFSISTNDLSINGDVTAGRLIGSGEKITNLNIDNIKRGNPLARIYGGTNNHVYEPSGIIFNGVNNDKFKTSKMLRWDEQDNVLYINNNDFIRDNSNLILNTSNILINNIGSSSNIILSDVKSYIENTLGIDNTTGIPVATATRAGIVKVGEGLFVSSSGVISILPEVIEINEPSFFPHVEYSNIPGTEYKSFILTYNPSRGTTYDIDINTNEIKEQLTFWYNFTNINNTLTNIFNSGNTNVITPINTNIILKGTSTLKPTNLNELKFEYTPLNTKYLFLDGSEGTHDIEGTHAIFGDDVEIQKIYGTGGIGGEYLGITFAFWFKCDMQTEIEIERPKSLFFFGGNTNYYIEISIFNISIEIKLFNFGSFSHTIQDSNLFTNKWNHLTWSISANGDWSIYINGLKITNAVIKRGDQLLTDVDISTLNKEQLKIQTDAEYNLKYIGRSRWSTNSYLKCSLSDIRIYNKELNNTDVFELYNLNNYTQYFLSFNDIKNNTKCDILSIGGGGGSSSGIGGSR